MAGSGTALTAEQIEQMKQNSPEYQNRQQIVQQWEAIFSNEQLCAAYLWSDKYIPVPIDPTTRTIAQEVAQRIISQKGKDIASNNTALVNSPNVSAGPQVTAATKFLRKCAAYTKQRNKADTKQAKQMMKQNPGIGAYTQEQILPNDPNNKASVRQAAINAGNKAALLDKQGDQKGLDVLQNQIASALTNKMYSTYFLYTYYSVIAGEDPNDPRQIGTKRGFQDQNEENRRKQTLNQLSRSYANYEDEFRPRGDPDKQAIDKYDQQRLNVFGGNR